MEGVQSALMGGAGSQKGIVSRGGYYSSMGVPPSNNSPSWYTKEYTPSNGSFNWKTRIGSFKFPSCGGTVTNDFSISANPTSLSIVQGNNGTSTISTAVTSGSARTGPPPAGLPPPGPPPPAHPPPPAP